MSESQLTDLTRRDALRAALLAGLGASLAARGLSAADGGTLITKAIPSTGERLPVIGLGTNAFNESIAPQLREVLARFSALRATMIDTAASYGESEAVIGALVAELKLRDKLFLATKLTSGGGAMGPPRGGAPAGGPSPDAGGPPPGAAGPPAGAMGNLVFGKASFERSLERLKTDHLDLLYVHNMSGTDAMMPEMLEWKQAKQVRYLGISTSADRQHTQMVEEMRRHPFDFVQVNYSLGDREAEQTVLPMALERRMAVVINVPFGGRGGRTLSAVSGKPLPPFAAEIGAASWAQLMLKYAASHPAVTCIVSGSTKVAHIDDNQQAARGVLPDAAMRKRIEAYWETVT